MPAEPGSKGTPMKTPQNWCARTAALAMLAATAATPATAIPLSFSGSIEFIEFDFGGALYSGLPTGTPASGVIDDVTATGSFAAGGIAVDFGCCIAAGALELHNDIVLDADTAGLLNALAGGNTFSEGQIVDGVDLEGDAFTAGNGRIEVGLSWLLDGGAFDNEDPLQSYPFDPADVRISLFFVFEEDAAGVELYSGIGRATVTAVPEPPVALLAALGIAVLAGWRRLGTR